MGASNSMEEMKIRIQSLITPATFIVNAEVLPINKYTDTLSAKASVALLSSTAGFTLTSSAASNLGNSKNTNGTVRNAKHAGET